MFGRAFQLQLAHGICAGVRCDANDAPHDDELLVAERAHAATLPARRRSEWVGGRVALRRAARAVGIAIPDPILGDDRGAPRLPAALVGSVSHKDGVAVGLIALSGSWTVGVDLERTAAPRQDIGRRVLRPEERAAVAAAADPGRALMLRFSLKEAVYKAIDPHLRRHVGFQEVAVWPRDDGTAVVEIFTAEVLSLDATFVERDGAWLTSARARLSPR